jgi:hypothetical protein
MIHDAAERLNCHFDQHMRTRDSYKTFGGFGRLPLVSCILTHTKLAPFSLLNISPAITIMTFRYLHLAVAILATTAFVDSQTIQMAQWGTQELTPRGAFYGGLALMASNCPPSTKQCSSGVCCPTGLTYNSPDKCCPDRTSHLSPSLVVQ